MFKKIWYKIYSLWIYLFKGLNSAEKITMGNKEEALNPSSFCEEKEEQDSVWQDLLKGELTQRVIDLRYETAHTVRESKKYEYVGGSIAKKNSFFTEYNGKIENSEGLKVLLVQDNDEDVATITTYDRVKRVFRLKFKYPFIPRFRTDMYVKKLVLREGNNGVVADFYLSKYHERYNNEHKLFLSEIKRIVNGDRRSDIIDLDEVSFITYKAFGCDDDIEYMLNNFKFIDIVEYDGNYILRFMVDIFNVKDYIDDVYNEESAKKFENHELREKASLSFSVSKEAIEKQEEDDNYYKKFKELNDE